MATEAQTCAIGILANRRNAQKSTGHPTLSMGLGLGTAKRFAKTSAPADYFMQNKPNFHKALMSATVYVTKVYENITPGGSKKNKPNFKLSHTCQRNGKKKIIRAVCSLT